MEFFNFFVKPIFQNFDFVGGRSKVAIKQELEKQNYNLLNAQSKSVSLSHSSGTLESDESFASMKNVTKKTSSVVVTSKVCDGQVTKTPWGVTLKPVHRTIFKRNDETQTETNFAQKSKLESILIQKSGGDKVCSEFRQQFNPFRWELLSSRS